MKDQKSIIDENKVEYQGIEYFEEIGYEYVHGHEMSPEGNKTETSVL